MKIGKMKKYTQDDLCPNISFKSWTELVKYPGGWSWNIFLKIEGPDDVFSEKSDYRYDSKEEAIKNLLLNYKETMNGMIDEAMEG